MSRCGLNTWLFTMELQAGAKAGTDSQPAHNRAVKRLTDTEQGSSSTGAPHWLQLPLACLDGQSS